MLFVQQQLVFFFYADVAIYAVTFELPLDEN